VYKRGVEWKTECRHHRESDTLLLDHFSQQLHAHSCDDLVVAMRSANKLFMTQWSVSGVSLKGGQKCV